MGGSNGYNLDVIIQHVEGDVKGDFSTAVVRPGLDANTWAFERAEARICTARNLQSSVAPNEW